MLGLRRVAHLPTVRRGALELDALRHLEYGAEESLRHGRHTAHALPRPARKPSKAFPWMSCYVDSTLYCNKL